MERTAASPVSRRTVRAFLLVPRLHSVLHDHQKDWNDWSGAYGASGGLLPYKSDGGASRTFEGVKNEDDYCQSWYALLE